MQTDKGMAKHVDREGRSWRDKAQYIQRYTGGSSGTFAFVPEEGNRCRARTTLWDRMGAPAPILPS